MPQIIFSSTAATYAPKVELLKESDAKLPANPYGESKLQAEKVLADICAANPATRFVTLRYFNPAGAHAPLEIGQARSVASALVNVAAEAAVGKRDKMLIYGDDYATPDGTCLRDYIHVQDLTTAHTQALDYLDRGGKSDVFNVGFVFCPRDKLFSINPRRKLIDNCEWSKFRITNDPLLRGGSVFFKW